MANMTKADLVRIVARELRMSQNECSLVVDAFLEAVKNALLDGRRIELRRFGSFIPKTKEARRALDPNTGEEITIPRRTVITFRPASVLRRLPAN